MRAGLVALVFILATAAGKDIVAAGNFQKLLGCTGDWDPTCKVTQLSPYQNSSVSLFSAVIPRGKYEYKITMDGAWDKYFGYLGIYAGANFAFDIQQDYENVTFVFDARNSWAADSVQYELLVAVGDFQVQAGCSRNWDSNCVNVMVQQLDTGSHAYATVKGVEKGSYNVGIAEFQGEWNASNIVQFEKKYSNSSLQIVFDLITRKSVVSEVLAPLPTNPLPNQANTCLGTPTWDKNVKLRTWDSLANGAQANVSSGGWWATGIHATLLPNGNVVITGWARAAEKLCPHKKSRQQGVTFVLDPKDITNRKEIDPYYYLKTIDEIPFESFQDYNAIALYCSGHNTLPDGKIFYTGGGKYLNLGEGNEIEYGIDYGRIFDPSTMKFTRISQPTPYGTAWYPTHQLLPDGRVLITAGFSKCCVIDGDANNGVITFDPVEYQRDPKNGSYWQELFPKDLTRHTELFPGIRDYTHIYLIANPESKNGKLYQTIMMGHPGDLVWFNTDQNPVDYDTLPLLSKIDIQNSRFFKDPSSFRRGNREASIGLDSTGSFVGTNEILIATGGVRTDMYQFDLFNPKSNSWSTFTNPIARKNAASVLLPDGTVLIINGRHPDGDAADLDTENDQRQPIIFDPYTRSFTEVSAWEDDNARRGYHNFAVLLKDGRVLIGGGTVADGGIGCERPDIRIFTPPYLSSNCDSRPRILVQSEDPIDISLSSDKPFLIPPTKIQVDSNSKIRADRGFALLTLSSFTHGFNQQHRYVPLVWTKGSDDQQVWISKSSSDILLPGEYLLFAISEQGVPSEGIAVRIHHPSQNKFQRGGDAATIAGVATFGALLGVAILGSIIWRRIKSGSFSSLELDAQQQLPVPNPNLHTREYLVNGQLVSFQGEIAEVTSPICTKGKGQTVIGSIPMLGEEEAHLAADAAVKAFGYGQGEWPKAPPKKRIEALEKFTAGLKAIKGQLVAILMWEICKNAADAEKEVDRTIKYIEDTIKEYKKLVNSEQLLTSDQGFVAKIRRVPLGVVLCSSPTNYPLNELYTTLIPALLIGNAVVLKVPRIGGLVHVPTYKLFQDCFPPGIVNALTGAGRVVMRALMKSGKMDAFAFIGSTKAAQELLREHPKPNRLRSCLGLEAKNAAIIFPDADLDNAVSECVLGSLSFNGMRCTAIKLIYVHSSIAEKFLEKFVKAVDSLPIDLPWEKGAKITPLCERNKVEFLDGLVSDAVSKGAAVSNPRGRKYDHTIYSPTILYPVNSSMRVFHEEQFGPLVPVTTFDDVNSVLHDIAKSDLGQQASVFTRDPEKLGHALDFLAHQVSRVNINCQSQRGPDVFPFTARKDSATATLSVFDALRTFSIRSMVAIKETPENHGLLKDVIKCESSEFMSIDYLVP